MKLRGRRIMFGLGCIMLGSLGISALEHGASWWDVFPLLPGACAIASILRVLPTVERTQSVQAGISGEANKKGEPNG